MDAFSSILFQITVMFLLILSGVFLYKIHWISEETNKQLSKIVISFVNPALMFCAYTIEFRASLLIGLLEAFGIAVVTHLLFIAAARMCLRKKDETIGLERYCCIYSNCAFIGIPLVSAVYGSEGVFYVTAYITVFNLLMWSHGIFLMSKDGEFDFVKKVILSPTIIATILGMIVFFTRISVPQVILKPLDYIGSMNTPLAMIVSGVTIAQSGFLKALKKVRIYQIAFWKLLFVPLVVMAMFIFTSVNHTALMATILVAACPVATASTLLAIQYGQDEKYASQIFGMTTLLSVATLPLLVFLGEIVRRGCL